jgi:hypothetical protein
MRIPQALATTDIAAAVDSLRCYYGTGHGHDHRPYEGALFDTWDSTGNRAGSVNQFTADDVVAVGFLSVTVPPLAVVELLRNQAADLSAMLEDLGPDRDLVTEAEKWSDGWVGWRLLARLDALPGVGPTIATKLFARKRPSLRPIYDTKVSAAIESKNIWEPLRARLQEDDMHDRLLAMRDEAGLGEATSAMRVFDVVTWMEATGKGCPE